MKGAPQKTQQQILEEKVIQIVVYEIEVIDGEGSGMYKEEEEVTISAPVIKDDILIIKKKFVGWENLPYKESTVTFEADENLSTRPLYEDDYSILFLIMGSIGGIGVLVVVKKKQKGQKIDEKPSSEEDDLLELLKE